MTANEDQATDSPTVWVEQSRTQIYDSPWVGLDLVRLRLPQGRILDHHLIRLRLAVGTIVHDGAGRILLIHRHRFIARQWVWEIPAGVVDEGEEAEQAARRETLEETGWELGELSPLYRCFPSIGVSDQQMQLFCGQGLRKAGDPSTPDEVDELAWWDRQQVKQLLDEGQIVGGLTVTAALWAMLFGPLSESA